MHILYKITFIPHLRTAFPKYYIGSKYNYKGNYFGSVDSSQIYEFTNGLQLREWWKLQKKNPDNFLFEIIESFENITALELVEKERDLQISLNVLSEDFFNHSIATKGFCSVKKSATTKQVMSEKTKAFWDSEEGLLKKQRLAERNRQLKSLQMKEKWKNPSEKMLQAPRDGRPKGAKDMKQRALRKDTRKVKHKSREYENAIDASKHAGVHPVTIRRWCKDNLNDWSYV